MRPAKELAAAEDRRDRCSQLVAEHAEEHLADLVGLLPLGDVADDANRSDRAPSRARLRPIEEGLAVDRHPAHGPVPADDPVLVIERSVAGRVL